MHSDFIVKTRMFLNLSEGSAYFQFALAKFISLSTTVMEDLCLQMYEAHDLSLPEYQLEICPTNGVRIWRILFHDMPIY